LFTEAIRRIAFHQVPDRLPRLERQIAAAAVLRSLRPAGDFLKFVDLAPVVEKLVRFLLSDFEPPFAEVIAATLDERHSDRLLNHFLQKWDVLGDELFLKSDGVC